MTSSVAGKKKRARSSLRIVPTLALALTMLVLLAAAGKQNRTVVSGTIVDPVTLAPLAGVEVRWNNRKAVTAKNGFYSIEVESGIRRLSYSSQGRVDASKVVIAHRSQPVRQDVLLPVDAPATHALVFERPVIANNKTASDLKNEPHLATADEWGNQEKTVSSDITNHSPIWAHNRADTILYATRTIAHKSDFQNLGVYERDLTSGKETPVATGQPLRMVRQCGDGSIIAANESTVFRVEQNNLRQVFKSAPRDAWILSIACGSSPAIYVTLDEKVPVEGSRYLNRSRAVTVSDAGEAQPLQWAQDPNFSFRYAHPLNDGSILVSRFSLDGQQQTILKVKDGTVSTVIENATEFLSGNADLSRIYYLYRNNLHYRDVPSGKQFLLLNSVRHADVKPQSR